MEIVTLPLYFGTEEVRDIKKLEARTYTFGKIDGASSISKPDYIVRFSPSVTTIT